MSQSTDGTLEFQDEQTAEEKAAELEIKSRISDLLFGCTSLETKYCDKAAEVLCGDKQLNLAELVKCKERCEALDNHTARQHAEDYRNAPDSVKEVMASYCEKVFMLEQGNTALRAKVQELELTIKNTQAH